jgi:hypothetical protein
MKFIKRYFWGFISSLCFIGSFIACFSTSGFYFTYAVVGSLGTGFAALYYFLHPPTPKPFEKIYHHEDWFYDTKQDKFPTLTIPVTEHGTGKKPRLEFRQGDFVFPLDIDSNGNITIIRDNDSIGRFNDLGVIIRNELY